MTTQPWTHSEAGPVAYLTGRPRWPVSCWPPAVRPSTQSQTAALRTLMLLEGRPAREIQGMRWFPRTRWPGYLGTCRELSVGLPVRLRDLDRAFWTANG